MEAYRAMKYLIEGGANDCQIASFLTALRMKGETADEISGFCLAMLEKVKNSTTAAFIAAGAGVIIAKHGNRSVSSMCGSADVLEQLGVNINFEVDDISRCLDEIGIGFIFAPNAHTAMKNVAKARKDMGIKTIFNILGPITNPAMANRRVLGVFDKDLMEKIVNCLKNLGVKRAFVVYGMEGFDVLVETHSSQEFDKACSSGAKIIGINNRNLKNMEININNITNILECAANKDTKDKIIVCESGIENTGYVMDLYKKGIKVFLIGSYFMQSKNLKQDLSDMEYILKSEGLI